MDYGFACLVKMTDGKPHNQSTRPDSLGGCFAFHRTGVGGESGLPSGHGDDINPYKWLRDTLERFPETKITDLEKLLPVRQV